MATNFEKLLAMNKRELSVVLCNLTECGKCPMSDRCYLGHNGFIDWMEADKGFGEIQNGYVEPYEAI